MPLCQDLAGRPEPAVPPFLEDSAFTYGVERMTSALSTALSVIKVDQVKSSKAESSKEEARYTPLTLGRSRQIYKSSRLTWST